MDESKIIIDTAIGKIKNLMAEEKYVEAHKGCLEILRFDPDNIKVIKLKNKIEKVVKTININAIKEDIRNLKPLLEAKNFDELFLHLKQLEPYLNQYGPLRKFIIHSQNEYKKEVIAKQATYLKQQKKEIELLRAQKKYSEAIEIAQKIFKENIERKKMQSLVNKLKEEWINYELEKGKTFLETDKYEDILLWLQKLKQISGQNKRLNSLIERSKKRQKQFIVDQKKDFIFTGKEKLKTLMQLKKFDKAALAAQEILDIDPTNEDVRKLFIQATKKEMIKINKLLIKQMKDARNKISTEYRNNKDKYVKI